MILLSLFLKYLKQFFSFTENFVGNAFVKVKPELQEAHICMGCFKKLEKYDSLCLQAARIQQEIIDVFNETQKKSHKCPKEVIECKNCATQFTSSDEMNDHDCFIENDDDYDIIECSESSDNEQEEKFSKDSNKVVNYKYTCNTCNEHFEKKRDYQQHAKLAHLPPNAEVLTCSKCTDSFFISEMELKLHNVVTHPIDPSSPVFNCPACNKAFSSKGLVNRHFGVHSSSSERPHVCEICGKSFFHYSSFQAHCKSHTDVRDYSCSQCPKNFRSQSHLNRHLKTHSKVKEHECSGKNDCVNIRILFH